MKRRVLSMLLVLAMVLTLLPATALAATTVIAKGVWNPGINWSITSDGTLTLKGNRSIQGNTEYVWSDYVDKVTKLVVADGITSIPVRCFSNMVNLKSAYIGKTVKTIEEAAFGGCTELTTVTFGVNPVLELIDYRAFMNCCKLKNFPMESLSALKTIREGAFVNAGLTQVKTPLSLEVIEADAFSENVALRSVYLNGANLRVYTDAFGNCTALEDIYWRKRIW